jgi:hypothetical protein
MAKNFAKLNSEIETIILRNNVSTLEVKKILNIIQGNDSDTEESITNFFNDGSQYIEYWLDEQNNPRERTAYLNGYYVPSLNKFTNVKEFDSWRLDPTSLLFGPREPWPLIDESLTDNNNYVLIWEEDNQRLIRKKIDENLTLTMPEQTQLYNTVDKTWSDI